MDGGRGFVTLRILLRKGVRRSDLQTVGTDNWYAISHSHHAMTIQQLPSVA